MPTARLWHGAYLTAAWLGGLALIAGATWLLDAGVYEARLEEGRVVRTGGLWSESFAALGTVTVGLGVATALLWLTGTWIAGFRDRRRMRQMSEPVHRKPLI